MKASLIPLDGGPPVEIVQDITIVGRRKSCDVRLPHPSVSKVHLVIVKTDGLLLVRDLGSTNGTKVNGQAIRRGALLPNDKLSIAAHKFRVQMGGDAEVGEEEPQAEQLVARKVRVDEKPAEPPHVPSLLEAALLDTDEDSSDEHPVDFESQSVELPHLDDNVRQDLPRFDD